jgi:hypothetical protein
MFESLQHVFPSELMRYFPYDLNWEAKYDSINNEDPPI